MSLLKQSSTDQDLVFFMVDDTDHITGKTGLSPTVTISKNGGSFASPAGSISEIAYGWYRVAGNATDTGTKGPLALHATGTDADPSDMLYEVIGFDPQDAVRLGLTALPNAAADAAGGLPVSDTGGLDLDAQRTDVAAVLVDTAVIGAAGAGLTALPWNAAWDSEVQSEVGDALTIYAVPTFIEMTAAFTEIKGAGWSSGTDTLEDLAVGIPPSAADVADAVLDELMAGHLTAGTVGRAISDAGALGTPLDAAGVRSAIGMASANLDTQLGTLSTYDGSDSSGVTTLLTRVPEVVSLAAINGQLDAALSDYDAPTKAELDSAVSSIESYGDSNWLTATGFSTFAGTPPTKIEMEAAFTEIKGAGWSSSTDTLEELADAVIVVTTGGDATQANQTIITNAIAALPTAIEIGTEILDRSLSAHDTAGTVGASLNDITPTGAGSTQVDHNFGGTDALVYSDDGDPIDNAEILIYLKVDYDAGRTARSYVVGISTTTVTGRWSVPVMLDPEEYVVQFSKQNFYGPDTVEIEVT